MSVVKKKDGRFFVVWYDLGKQIWEPFGRGDGAKKAAECRDLEIKLARARGNFRTGTTGQSPLFSEIAQAYINARRTELSEKTRGEILGTIALHILPVIGNKPIRDITINDWNAIQENMFLAKTGNRSINTYFRYVNALMNWAVSNEYLTENPWRGRKPLKQKKFKIDLFTVEEFLRILSVAPDHLAWAMKVAYFVGLRPGKSELFALKWEDIDFQQNRIRIYAPKTDSYRWQYVSVEFMGEMQKRYEEIRARAGAPPYVCTYQNQQISSLKTAWATALAKAGIKKTTRLYDIRHFHITHALSAGAPILDLADRVGHTDATMIVKVYSHLVDEIRTKKPFAIPPLHASLLDKTLDNNEKGVSGKPPTP